MCFVLLIIAANAVQHWLVDTSTGVAVCLTPKVANSEIVDYVRWTRALMSRASDVCKWAPSLVKDYTHACKGHIHNSSHRLHSREPPPLRVCTYERFGLLKRCFLDEAELHLGGPLRLLVPLRDPYTKLLSAFHSKFCGDEKSKHPVCHAKQGMNYSCHDKRAKIFNTFFSAVRKASYYDLFLPTFLYDRKNAKTR